MIEARKFEQPRSRNVSRKKTSAFDVNERVSLGVDDQGRHADRGQNIADVDLGGHPHHRHGGSRARTQSLEATPPSLQGRIVRTRRRPKRKTEAASPALISVCEEGAELLGPKRRTRKAAIEHQSSASLWVGCGKQSSQCTAFGYAELRGALGADRVHNRADIVHA